MKIVEDVCSMTLPYTPQRFQNGSLRGLGHPQLWPVLQDVLQHRRTVSEAVTVYRTRPHRVWTLWFPGIADHSPVLLVIKQFGWRNMLQYLLSPWRPAKAWKAYRTACHLLSHHLPTPLPLGVGERRAGGFLQDSVYITMACPDCVSLQVSIQTLTAERLSEVQYQMAAYVRRMHDSGLVHRDLTLGNFLLQGSPGRYTLYLVDLNRAVRFASVPLWRRAIDLARLQWPVAERQFYTYYCEGNGNAAALLRIVSLYRRWRLWRQRLLALLRPWRVRQRAAEHSYKR